MSETSALMDTLRQEGVSPDLLRAVEEYRTAPVSYTHLTLPTIA